MPTDPAEICNVAERNTEAWCSRSGEAVASFLTERGNSIVNQGEPAIGREAIAVEMQDFFADFPNLFLRMEEMHG